MGGDRDGKLEFEHSIFCCGCGGADGGVGEEEGGEVQEGFWGEVYKEEVWDVALDLVDTGFDACGDEGSLPWSSRSGSGGGAH